MTRRSSPKQKAAQRAWVERQQKREAVPLDGDHSWALAHSVPHAFDHVVEDMKAVRGIRFPPGHCWPEFDGVHLVIINRRNGINCVMVPKP